MNYLQVVQVFSRIPLGGEDCTEINRDNFAAEYSVVSKIWEALSPDTVLSPFEKDYKWLSQVYQSVQPSSGHGKLIWHSLGAKTIELIHQNVHVDAVRDDLDTLVLDAYLLEAVLSNPDPKKAKEIKLKRRLRGHGGNPKFKKLSERLDALKDRFESGQINSVEFLKALLEIARGQGDATSREGSPSRRGRGSRQGGADRTFQRG
jgi:type I restriction enzyme, R subunit